MLALISPAKKLDTEKDAPLGDFTVPQHLDNSGELVDTVKELGKAKLKALMKLTELHLEKTKVTAQGVANLKKALPKCEIKGP